MGHPVSEKVRNILATCHIGKRLSPEAREKMSLSERGERNPNWRGGVTPANSLIRWNKEYGDWRTSVFVRDGYVCQKCGAYSEKLHAIVLAAHHMDSFADFPEKRLDIENGITFCDKCHREFHRRYGTHHNRKWQTDEFLSIGIEGD
jgi:5-methylcytosine-specific restriction endonuclease McrA